MDIRNSLDGLRSLLGVNPTAPVCAAVQREHGHERERIRFRPGDVQQRGQ
jgi:hypothetical protein